MSEIVNFSVGERNNGFYVLLNNLKHGAESSREVFDFLKESCAIEDVYAKQLSRLAKSCSSYSSKGSFGPMWIPVRTLCEKLSNLHQQLVLTWTELMREVHKYSEQQQKHHKQVKDEESSTQECVQSFQQIVQMLQKAKESYHARCTEREKLKRESASLKDLEKAEGRCKKASEDYRNILDKYTAVRSDFETKMIESCKKFKGYEDSHLKQMREFVDKYSKTWQHQHVVLGQMHDEFRVVTDELTVDKLIEKFIAKKKTGDDKPGPMQFEEFDPTAVNLHAKTPDADKLFATTVAERNKQEAERDSPQPTNLPTPMGTSNRLSNSSLPDKINLKPSAPWSGFLPGRKKKAKKLEKGDGSEGAKTPVAEIDDEGYTIRPTETQGPENGNEKESSDASSEDEESLESFHSRSQKLKVEIRPANATDLASSNTDGDLVNLALSLRLSPTIGRRSTPPLDSKMRKSFSVNETLHSSRLQSFDVDISSTASSDQGSSEASAPSRKLSALSETFSKSTAGNEGRTLKSLFKWINPLTKSASSTIPLAVMLKETVSAHFKKTDENSCFPRVAGELIFSFPLRMFHSSASAFPPLAFRLQGTDKLDVVLLDNSIVSQHSENVLSSKSSRLYVIDMAKLQSQVTSSSDADEVSYVNVDILKYQVIKDLSGEPPLNLVSSWHSNGMKQEFNLSYCCAKMRCLSDVKVLMKVNDARKHFFSSMSGGNMSLDMKSMPPGEWLASKELAVWNLGTIDGSRNNDWNKISATFSSIRPLSEQIAVKFISDNATFSQATDIQLVAPGYRLTHYKRCFGAGKYTVESIKK